MSSGGIALAPAAVPVAAAGAVVAVGAIAVGAAAVLLVRAAGAAIEGTVQAVGDYGVKVELRVAGMELAAANTFRWQVAAADVVGINARIRLLSERVAAAGVTMAVPSPLRLTSSQSPAEIGRWVADLETELARAQETLDALLPPPKLVLSSRTTQVDAELAEAYAAHRKALRSRYAGAVTTRPAPVSPDRIQRTLMLLDPDATTEERARVLSAAALVSQNQDQQVTYLRALHRLITDDINPKVARRRVAASWVQSLEDGPLSEVLASAAAPARLSDVTERLRSVVTGEQDLTPQLHADGTQLMEWAEEAARQVFVRELVKQCLADQGYQVEQTADASNGVGLRLNLENWAGEHTAEVWVDGQSGVCGQLVREVPAVGDNANLLDRARCDGFADALEAVVARLGESGVEATVIVNRDPVPRRTHETVEVTPASESVLRHRTR